VAENTGPTITSAATVTVDENTTPVIDVNSTDDADSEGAGLTYSISGGVDAALFAIDAASGALSFVATPDFETPGDDGLDNVYDVEVTVTDSAGLDTPQSIEVTVQNVNEAPEITSAATASVDENTTEVMPRSSQSMPQPERSALSARRMPRCPAMMIWTTSMTSKSPPMTAMAARMCNRLQSQLAT